MQATRPSPRKANWPTKVAAVSTSTKRAMTVGFALIALCFGGFGVWAAAVPLSSAIVANGQVVVASKRKLIMHPTGGVIRTIAVEDGSVVKEGAVLMTLDDSDAADRYTRARDSFYFALANEARLTAETRDLKEPAYSKELMKAAAEEPAVKAIVDGQTQLFTVRQVEIRGQLSILEEQHRQLTNELKGIEAERRSTLTQVGLSRSELQVVDELYKKGYTTRTRVFGLRREIAQLAGNAGRLDASAARTKSAMIESGLKLLQAKNALMTETQSQLRETSAKVPNLREQYRAASLAYERMTIRAPVAGTVMASRVNTIGSVVRPGETILEIVPKGDRLMVEVMIHPTDVDSVKVGLETEVKLTGLNQRELKPLHGRVTNISADAMQDPRTNAPYFLAHIDVPDAEIKKMPKPDLYQPGMPAAVMIKTGERTAFAYLTQPLADTVTRAWREE